jgi:hypothetical protein
LESSGIFGGYEDNMGVDRVNARTPVAGDYAPSLNMRRAPPGRTPTTPPRVLATLWRISATMLCLGVHGCTQPTGGAVELSWALRSTLDRDISDCAAGRIGRIRLWWETDTDRTLGRVSLRGQSRRDGVRPADRRGGAVDHAGMPDGLNADPEHLPAPPPIVRDVAIGQAVTLDALLLVVQVDDCTPQACICLP